MKKWLILLMTVPISILLAIGQEVPLYRSQAHYVEVYAKVLDKHGKYVGTLTKDQFEIRDNGELRNVESLEPITTGFSCAILMDRTGSVLNSLPMIKNAISRFIDAFRADDLISVYTFNVTLRKTQDFTRDKNAAKQAVLRAIAGGATALFDSISEVLVDLSSRTGKKTIVVFTDGMDNSSFLNSAAVMRRAKSLGIPLYFVAQGEAVKQPKLVEVMREISNATSGETYLVKNPHDMDDYFQIISREIQNSYLLTYAFPSTSEKKWRTIDVSVKGMKGLRVHAREGYFPN